MDGQFVSKKVDSITFGMLSPKIIKKMASVKIVTPELYDKEGYPVDGGLMDIRLGIIDPGLRCKTCGSKIKECLGHFGYIELARPIIHIKYVPIILDLLRCSCRECGKLLIPQNKLDDFNTIFKEETEEESSDPTFLKRKKVLELITKLKTANKCPHCKSRQKKISLDKPSSFVEDEKRLSPIEVRARLEKIPDDDLVAFGFNCKLMRPEWAVLTLLPIPPVTVRPSITLESGERSEDDLTHKLGDIVRINQRLFENINAGAPEIIVEDLWDLLQYHMTTYFDNEIAQLPVARHRSGQPLKTLTARIKSKEGRIRHNLAGKRTNFSARTVISPDPMIDIDEVAIPYEVASKLTVPEKITSWNMEFLKKFVERGPKEYPGSNYITRPDGRRKKITDDTKEQLLEELQPGYFVERHLMDGDLAMFNRQPSLHRMSMMCHRIKVLPHKTFRINPAVCAPYNADFDGDEMNLHIPQNEEAMAEAEILAEVQTQLISPRYGLSIIGCIQDAVAGNYILTNDSLSMSRREAVDLLINIGITDFKKIPNKEKISGKEVFSCLIPDDFNYYGKLKDGTEIVIRNGKLESGIMDKSTLGGGSGLMLRMLHKKYGPRQAIIIIGQIFKLGIYTLLKYGFSAALSDIEISNEARDKIDKIINEHISLVDKLIEDYKNGELEAFPGRSVKETLELKILELLNKARNETGNIVLNNVDKTKSLVIMTESGAKGGPLNIAQMSACVGQQALRGGRINKGYNKRTLSCFKRDELSPASHGFIAKGFKEGLKPYEFFFGAMTGRDSLMDTALRTPKSGYLYRRLANALQDVKVNYDGTSRDSNNTVIQFEYGEDLLDVSKTENGKINVQRIVDELK
ncbi:MAG: DNA-directed RNA polymerase subunit A' [Candidatus Woesearchaeota archaeon]